MALCDFCDGNFDTEVSLFLHIKNIHKSADSYTCIFKNCKRSYKKIHSFQEHVKNKHQILKCKTNDTSQKSVLLLKETEEVDSNPAFCIKNVTDDEDSNLNCYNFYNDNYFIPCENYNNLGEHNMENLTDNYLDYLGIQYVANLNKYTDLNRCRVQSIINNTKDMCKNLINHIIKECEVLIVDESEKNKLLQILNRCANVLEPFDSEQKCFTRFKKLKSYVEPESVIIGDRMEFRKRGLHQNIVHVPVNIQVIPLRKVFKNFFEMPNVYHQTMEYLKSVNNNEIITNFVQAEYWQSRLPNFKEKTVLPLVLFFDDYQNNNPLGSHKNIAKTGAVYISIPCLPVEYQSKLENHFVFSLFNTIDREIFGNKLLFSRIIEELNALEENGITLELPEGEKKLYFELALCIGDNLGLHSLLGFTKSFNAQNFVISV